MGQGRREFLKNLGIVAAWTAESAHAEDTMQYRVLGSTGEKVSIVGLGGYHIGNPQDDAEGIRLVRTAIDNGINFMDNSWDYHDGKAKCAWARP